MRPRFVLLFASTLLGTACSPGAELGKGSGASYYGNRLACQPWGVLDNGQDAALSHALRLAIAAYVPGELSRCAVSPAVQSADDQELSQHFGAVHLTVERNASGLIALRFAESSIEKDFLAAAASFHGLPRFVEQDADTNPALVRSVAPVFAPIVQQWLKVHRQAVFTQAESLGHRYLFIKLTQPYLLNNVPTQEEMRNVTAAGYVDCDFNRASPGCKTNTVPITHLSGVQPVPLEVNWSDIQSATSGFYPRFTPNYMARFSALAPAQQRRMILGMQGRSSTEIAATEHVDQSAVGLSIGTALAHLGFASKSPGASHPIRQGIAAFIGADFALMQNLLRANSSLHFYQRFDTRVDLKADDFEIVSFMVLELSREEIANALGVGRTELSRRIVDLRSRLGLAADVAHTRENDVQLIIRMADLSMPHLPAPQAASLSQAPMGRIADIPDDSLIRWLEPAIQSDLVKRFLKTIYGTELNAVIGKPISALRFDRQGIAQRFEYAELALEPAGKLSATPHGANIRDRILALAPELSAQAVSSSTRPHAIRLDWSNANDPKYLQVRRWAEDFRPWVAIWQGKVGFTPVPGDIVEVYGHLLYLGGPVALVHCGYNPNSPGCSCNDSGVVPLRLDAPLELLPPNAMALLNDPRIAFPYTLPYVLAGFSHSKHTAMLYYNDSEPSRFIRFMIESLGFASRAALLRHVYGIDFSELASGVYATGNKQIQLTDNNVFVLKGLAQGVSAIDTQTYATDQVEDMNTQLGLNGLSSDRLLLEVHRLTRICASPYLDRSGGILSGHGSLEPWTASFDSSHAPLLRLDPKRGALVPSGEWAQGQPTMAWATWRAAGSDALVALTGSLADPRFIEMDHLSLGAFQPTQVPTPSPRRANICPLLVPALPQRRLSPIGLAQLTTQPFEAIAGAFRYAKTGATTALISDSCIAP